MGLLLVFGRTLLSLGLPRGGSCRIVIKLFMSSSNNKKNTLSKYPDAAGMLNADITVGEVAAMLAKMKDVGASLDNVPPVVMQSHAGHLECAVIKALTQQFNDVFRTGVVPDEWQKHRMMLVHKGHGAHQSALDSYRAIGIGCCCCSERVVARNSFLWQWEAMENITLRP